MSGTNYTNVSIERSVLDHQSGRLVLEFGTDWCGHCRAAQKMLNSAFQHHPEVSRMKVEDGPGRPLGRSFRVKLWPTLVFLHNGEEVTRLVRPQDPEVLEDAFARFSEAAGTPKGGP
jgi:thioredoxin 1